MKRRILVLSLILFPSAISCWAQVSPGRGAGVRMGHLYYNVRDVEANKKFWIALGATPVVMGKTEVLKFPNVLIVLNRAESSGPTEGSVVNHVAFRVPDMHQWQAKMKAAGYRVGIVEDGDNVVGNVFTPEDERIELLQDATEHVDFTPDGGQKMEQPKMSAPILFHHIHIYLPEGAVPQAVAWYVQLLGGTPGKRWHYQVINLPDVELDFKSVAGKMAPTKGRNLDHIDFEIQDLEAICKKLQAHGVTFESPYKKLRKGVAAASLTDPWGTSIELTQGLNH